jgi:hypothetical protein
MCILFWQILSSQGRFRTINYMIVSILQVCLAVRWVLAPYILSVTVSLWQGRYGNWASYSLTYHTYQADLDYVRYYEEMSEEIKVSMMRRIVNCWSLCHLGLIVFFVTWQWVKDKVGVDDKQVNNIPPKALHLIGVSTDSVVSNVTHDNHLFCLCRAGDTRRGLAFKQWRLDQGIRIYSDIQFWPPTW